MKQRMHPAIPSSPKDLWPVGTATEDNAKPRRHASIASWIGQRMFNLSSSVYSPDSCDYGTLRALKRPTGGQEYIVDISLSIYSAKPKTTKLYMGT